MNNTLSKEEGLAFIQEQLNVGCTRKEITDALQENGVPVATAYRWHREVYISEPPQVEGQCVKDIVLGSLLDCLRAAQAANDTEAIAKHASALARAAQTLRASHI